MDRTIVRAIFLLLVASSAATSDVAAQARDADPTGLAVELSAGVVSNPGALGHTSQVDPAGYFSLGGPDPAPSLGLAVVLPPTLLGLRPVSRVSWAPGADLRTLWIPCAPGAACPSILALLAPADGRVSRREALLGLERELPVALGPVISGASLFVGVRQYRLSWEDFGEPGEIFLPAGSHGETDLLVKGGLSGILRSGRWELVTRVEAGLGRHGPGVVDAVQPVPDSPATIDLGRKTLTEYTVSMGIRRGIP